MSRKSHAASFDRSWFQPPLYSRRSLPLSRQLRLANRSFLQKYIFLSIPANASVKNAGLSMRVFTRFPAAAAGVLASAERTGQGCHP